ncbi:MAG TPA: S1/P1 nuclease [Bryobacterales bacterium]|nr:S1/P1 nuclease [Bryobacterales bacterium]
MKLRLLALTLLGAHALFAWGSVGHKIASQIAEAHLDPQAAAAVRQILGPNRHLADIANLADDVRDRRPETEPWHFVDIPLDATSYDPARDCPRGECLIAAIARFQAELAKPGLAPPARFEALYNLVHLVEDLHQPLHCEDNHDRGGNDVAVEFLGKAGNLHRAWDSGILDWMLRYHPDHWEFLARRLGRISRTEQSMWSRGTAEEWAMESHGLARDVAYQFHRPAAGPVALDMAYVRRAAPVVRRQLAKGGIRLAYLLNQTLGGGRPARL